MRIKNGGEMEEDTLLIIKPDAVSAGTDEKILERIKTEKFEIVEMKYAELSLEDASRFYAVHYGKEFYNRLINFMSSGKIKVCHLKRINAIKYLREIVGATDPKDALPGTLRSQFGTNGCVNAVHASDSVTSAKEEIAFFFN
jgi:nucleoside-diphosphate kinase